ncbi:TetR/AcrR family transcriptional regulator [Gryllotalpicola kribbensis]|jgi:AcrR family transcriptional regulator|uniref:TetR/AcrR family transcriptional regulator n=1 Tax=Gryllotalpicola kribbensis TaxID=993084 RepID=A0ABP8APK2_9MICO
MPRGAARSEASRTAILTAIATLIDRMGFDNVTIEAIATEAGVGKQTIYRWYPSKNAIVAEALAEGTLVPESFPVPETGDALADISAWLERVLAFLGDETHAALLGSLLSASIDSPEIGLRVAERLGMASPTVAERVQQARDAGQLRPALTGEQIDQLIFGLVVMRALGRAPYVPGEAHRLVAALLGVAPD